MRAVKCIKLPEKNPPLWDDGVTADQLFIIGKIYKEKYITFTYGVNGQHGSIVGIVGELDASLEAHIFTVDYLLENFPDAFLEVPCDPPTT